jgi:lysine biosynthesis protein LysW
MVPARCPVCNDIISLGVAVKLNQAVICPTCLASLQVVSLSPLELELPQRSGNGALRPESRFSQRKNHKEGKKSAKKKSRGTIEIEDEYYEYDDYVLEKRFRHKSEHEKKRRGTVRE